MSIRDDINMVFSPEIHRKTPSRYSWEVQSKLILTFSNLIIATKKLKETFK